MAERVEKTSEFSQERGKVGYELEGTGPEFPLILVEQPRWRQLSQQGMSGNLILFRKTVISQS